MTLLILRASNRLINLDQITTALMNLHGKPEGDPSSVLHLWFSDGREELFKSPEAQDLWAHLKSIAAQTL
jgi:hypothetical protein